jgi:hypothetical protein
MKVSRWKIAALVVSGSILLQLGGCTTIIAQILAQQVFSSFLRGILDALLGGTGAATQNPG